MPGNPAPRLPSGTVTFLFTDIEGSTRLLTALGDRYPSLLQRHAEIMRGAFSLHGGTEVSTEGDSFFVVFGSAPAALRAAVDAQRALTAEPWPAPAEVHVRMGLHTGEGQLGGDNYVGLDVHRAARIAAAGWGGQILVSEGMRGLVRGALPDGTDLRDLGDHRLKDLPGPEHIWQVDIAGLTNEFPALRSVGRRAGNLPEPPTPLIGREHELAEIARLLGQGRLLTLTGPGGTGKTRLALAGAAQLADEYRDGAHFVALEDATERTAVAGAIATALGIRDRPDRNLEEGIAEHVRERELLLLLDNFEQAVAGAPLVAELLAGAAGIRALVTSRIPLHVAGEQELPVPPLALPDPEHLPDNAALSQYESVALFIARARSVRPDFSVTNDNAPAVAEICSRLDGLPLAIELAAAAMKLLRPHAVLERLERHLPIPGSGPADVPARQRTLRGAIDWSYGLLGEPEQRLFRRLAVFGGGWTLDMADRVCNPEGELGIDTLDGLAGLADASLIKVLDDDDAAVDAEMRFAMLQVIRDYATETLAGGADAETVARRHATEMLDLAVAAEPQLVLNDLRRWQRRLHGEQENLRVALRWAIDEQEATIAQQLAGSLWRFWHYWGELREARRWLEAALALPDGEPGARATALIGLAGVIYWQGEPEAAQRLYDEAIPLLEEIGDERRVAETLFATTYTAAAREDAADALGRGAEAIERYRRAGDEVNAELAESQMKLGRYYELGEGTAEEVVAATRHVIEILTAQGRAHERADWLGTLSQLHQMQGDLTGAMEAFRDTARAYHELGDLGMLPWFKVAAAQELGLGHPERAMRLAGVAARAAEELGGELAAPLMAAGDPIAEARKLLDEEVVARELEAGRAMDFDEAVAYLLADDA